MNTADFHALYVRHAPDVHRFAFFLIGDRAEAEDLAAETFVRAWSSAEAIRTETMKGYLFAIVRNLVRERLRRNTPSTAIDEHMTDPGPGPDVSAGDRIELRAMLEALQQLPEADRAALLMRSQDDMSHEEIARALGISVAAVKVKIHRARIRLHELKLRRERSP